MSDAVLIDIFNDAWRWTGRRYAAITAINPFGHLILKDELGCYSYCDPELLVLTDVADGDEALFAYMADPDVREVWESTRLIEQARAALGELGPGRSYHWKIAPALGGAYEQDNIATVSIEELVRFTGSLARQIKDLPDGTTIELKVVE
ncbi:MAG: DUF1851 domain-containing protein [Sphingobium sp.]|nr:DUF1851 domain-containing protein [Sphingobium sp.]